MRFVKVLLLLVVFILGLLFFAQNSTELGLVQAAQEGASSNFLTLKFNLYLAGLQWQSAAIPLYVVILCAFGTGMLFAILLLLADRVRIGCSLMSRNRAVRSLEREVERLRGETAKEAKLLSSKSAEVKELAQAAKS